MAAGDALAALRRYSLVTPAGDGMVLVHRLVQAVALAHVSARLGPMTTTAVAPGVVEVCIGLQPAAKVPAAVASVRTAGPRSYLQS